jgi:hypothetical protein
MSAPLRVFFFVGAAVLAVVSGGQPLYAQSSPAQGAANDARAACAQDAQKLCANVQPGGGRIIACLKQHQDQVSDSCKQAIAKAMAARPLLPPRLPQHLRLKRRLPPHRRALRQRPPREIAPRRMRSNQIHRTTIF